MTKPIYLALSVLIVALAVIFRVAALDLKPPHFDEGINGFFVDQMIAQGYYKYDPANYHGPLHFYLLLFCQQTFGRNLFALRAPSVIAGIGTVLLILTLWRRVLTDRVCLLFAAFVAISPACVFISRYAIHESEMNLFLLSTALGLALLYREGTRLGLWLTGLGITGMVLTKETYVVHLGCLLLAYPTLLLFERFFPSDNPRPASRKWGDVDLAIVLTAGLASIAFLYSGTFFNPAGISGLWMTFAEWFKTGLNDGGHTKPFYYWGELLTIYEWAGLVGLIACARYIFGGDRVLRFTAIVGAGTFVAFSLIPYKTPWSILPTLWPLFLALADVCVYVHNRYRTHLIYLIPALTLGHAAWAAGRVNFFGYDNPKEKYVYVQTFRDLEQFTGPVLAAARQDPRLYHAKGSVVLESQFPIPWQFGGFTRVGYYGNASKLNGEGADFLLVDKQRVDEVEALLDGNFYTGEIRVRDGMGPARYYLRAEIFAPWCKDREIRVFGGAAPE